MSKQKDLRAIEITKSVHRKYDGRIVMAGAFNGYRQSCVWHCLDCDQFFRQRYESIWDGAKTRCKCNHSEPISLSTRLKTIRSPKGIGRSAGHTCLPSYEIDDWRFLGNIRKRLDDANLPVDSRYDSGRPRDVQS